jgi:predicted N-formylglutamate amidohydrolase
VTRGSSPQGLQLLVTCEHASPAVPKELGDLGLSRAVLRSHRGWDPGALGIAEAIARAFAVPLHVGQWSRLVADLNRSEDHARVVAARVDGELVPGNQLDKAALAQRLARFWRPYRQQAETAITAAARRSRVLHLSVHSFTPQLGGVVRKNDIGLLCDPQRPLEVAFCESLKTQLVARGLSVRRNFPYFGDTDGFTTHLRARLPVRSYLGIEIECNQRLVSALAGERKVAAALVAALQALELPSSAPARGGRAVRSKARTER